MLTVHYLYDALCGWCYAFSPVIEQLRKNYKDRLAFKVLSGGMVPPEFAQPISAKAGYIAGAYTRVEGMTGVKFGAPYLQHIFHPEQSPWVEESLTPAIALSIVKDAQPDNAVPFAAALQKAHMQDGLNLADRETYRGLAESFGLDGTAFLSRMEEEEWKEAAQYDFALVKQLGITGFPAVIVQTGETQFYLIANGYAPYEDLAVRLDNVLAEAVAEKSTVE